MKGLVAIHRANILHRDIKLENVLINVVGEIKIGDFGVSKKMNPREVCYDMCGTPAYIAPPKPLLRLAFSRNFFLC